MYLVDNMPMSLAMFSDLHLKLVNRGQRRRTISLIPSMSVPLLKEWPSFKDVMQRPAPPI